MAFSTTTTLILGTLRLLESRDAAAWVLFKLDGGLDHILIDEGQDTSPEQWRIVQRLAEEFFAGKRLRAKSHARTIFVVGDEKQSIFSFQGADPAQFDVQHEYFAERAGAKEGEFVTVQLSTSRRSAPEILQVRRRGVCRRRGAPWRHVAATRRFRTARIARQRRDGSISGRR